MTDKRKLQLWWSSLDELGDVLGRLGPDEECCEGLSQRQCAILRLLVEREGARLSLLAEHAGVTPSALTRILERLEQRGLVERVRGCCGDGRAAAVRITDEGRRMRALLDELMLARTSAIVKAIPDDQRESVLEALKTLHAAASKTACSPLNQPVACLCADAKEKK